MPAAYLIRRFYPVVALACLACLFSSVTALSQTTVNPKPRNVLGKTLQPASDVPAGVKTGFYRSGFCNTGPEDEGHHVVASIMTQRFLDFTKSRGNDLQTPRPDMGFPGLKPGDGWCLCAARWQEAEKAGVAPPVDLAATHESATGIIPLNTLKKYQRAR